MDAHEKESIQIQCIFENLYLKPIKLEVDLDLIKEFNFHLLVVIKTEAYGTLNLLVKLTGAYIALTELAPYFCIPIKVKLLLSSVG